MDAIGLGIFSSRMEAICDEMGATLQRSAFSPNIKDRLDFSCAIFDAQGGVIAQAAHIPVHLGSMAYAMADIVAACDWRPGQMVVMNDPFKGGTHLPDITLIAPQYIDQQLIAFVVNRAHHANVGARSPGSMPLSTSLVEEGVLIPPTTLVEHGDVVVAVLQQLLQRIGTGMSPGDAVDGDFAAQISANRVGGQRLQALILQLGRSNYLQGVDALNHYAERLVSATLQQIPEGVYQFSDLMDDDGSGQQDIVIATTIKIEAGRVAVDFSGTSQQVKGNINAPLAVAAAGVYYLFRCLMPRDTPACAGAFGPITISAPLGSLLNPIPPAAVAAGNVETSSRVVDVVAGAMAQALPGQLPAASHGSMNNVAMGSCSPGRRQWDYYETIGGGMGAGAVGGGMDALQTHMTNTLNTPIEVLEMNYPLRLLRYQIRRGSGGAGLNKGGDGIIREYQFMQPTEVTLLTERRRHAPWGLNGGADGQRGFNLLNGEELPPKVHLQLQRGDRLVIQTPGGGGWGIETSSTHQSEES